MGTLWSIHCIVYSLRLHYLKTSERLNALSLWLVGHYELANSAVSALGFPFGPSWRRASQTPVLPVVRYLECVGWPIAIGRCLRGCRLLPVFTSLL